MSGGVDSSYVARLLCEEGYEVEGLYMKMHGNDLHHAGNLQNIQIVCDALKIPHHVLDVRDEFQEKVYRYFVETYIAGETPNPCARCNPSVKFGESLKLADQIGADYLASGHYARHDGQFLYRGADPAKDQSYFLFALPQRILPRLLFPLGNRVKEDIKREALEIGFLEQIARSKESQEICFVENDYVDVLSRYVVTEHPGDVLNEQGEIIGEHEGYMHYTIGKRRGFRLKVAHEPHYVLDVDAKHNTITVGPKEHLAKNRIEIRDVNLFTKEREFQAEVKIRYRSAAVPAWVKIEENQGRIELQEPAYGVANGQAAVFYEGEKLLGGGWIKASA